LSYFALKWGSMASFWAFQSNALVLNAVAGAALSWVCSIFYSPIV